MLLRLDLTQTLIYSSINVPHGFITSSFNDIFKKSTVSCLPTQESDWNKDNNVLPKVLKMEKTFDNSLLSYRRDRSILPRSPSLL